MKVRNEKREQKKKKQGKNQQRQWETTQNHEMLRRRIMQTQAQLIRPPNSPAANTVCSCKSWDPKNVHILKREMARGKSEKPMPRVRIQ